MNLQKRLAYPLLLTCLVLLLIQLGAPTVDAKDKWTSVRSKNFFLLGNCSEKEIRQVATRLEQFREVFSRVFPGVNFKSPVPTNVIVFKSDSSYRPFKPTASTAGYFQPGQDVNYITLTTEVRGEQDPFNVIYHEYVHLMVNNTVESVPTWFNEGLAEYYSTFFIADDQKVTLGKPIGSHVFLLREKKILPLRTLFAVDHDSPYYNEREKQSIFYAESWALMHYLILGNQGKRLPQLGTFLKLLTDKVPVEDAFQKAFQSTFEQMEKELKEYLKNDRYPVMTGHFEQKLALDKEMQSAPVSEAEAQAYLGDLLLHSRRQEAEGYLQKALELDPDQPLAHASLGMLRVYQGRFDDALRSLERSLAANSRNYLTHYYYALALSRQSMDSNNFVSDYPAESAAKMRAALRKAIELEPTFPESYSLLAFINMVKGEQLDESIALIRKALAVAPGKEEYSLTLAQLYLHKQDFKAARLALEPIARNGADAQMRQHAQSLLDRVTSIEKRMSEVSEETREAPPRLARKAESTADDSQEVSLDPLSYLGEALRKPAAGEVRVQGTLVRIDCGAKAIVFTIKTGDRLLRVQTATFEKMDFRTFTATVSGEITCGIRKNEDAVVVTYQPTSEPRAKTGGTAISLEFVPKEFKLKL